jgi:hypothetical protein
MWFKPNANLSVFTKRVLAPQRHIKGFANADDAMHFAMVLGYQNQTGFGGDLLEIGTYFGRSTLVLAYHQLPGQVLEVCDAFEAPTADHYDDKPTVEDVLTSIRAAVPGYEAERMCVHNCLSKDLTLSEGARFRFAHVDGGHSTEEALHDLRLVADHILPHGVIAVDDYDHPRWPGVKVACDQFLLERTDFTVFADMNRWGALGRKLYLARA